MDNKVQKEWDHQAYHRKFNQTLSLVQIGDKAPEWTWIGAIGDNNLAYGNPRLSPIGQYVCQAQGGKPYHSLSDFPVIQFFYAPLLPGAYKSRRDPSTFYYLVKRHLKSYRIGLSDETHVVYMCDNKGYSIGRVSYDIDLESPVFHPLLDDDSGCQVFTKKLVRLGTMLFADGDSIGFMEKGTCVIRHKNFIPLVQPYLGSTWQIES